jgi:hypothetical protein
MSGPPSRRSFERLVVERLGGVIGPRRGQTSADATEGAGDMAQMDFGHEARRLRVGTLVRLRWIAAGGQIAALLVARLVLHVDFPTGPAPAPCSPSTPCCGSTSPPPSGWKRRRRP